MGSSADREAVLAAYNALDAAFDTLTSADCEAFSHSERLVLQQRMEHNLRRAPIIEHKLIR